MLWDTWGHESPRRRLYWPLATGYLGRGPQICEHPASPRGIFPQIPGTLSHLWGCPHWHSHPRLWGLRVVSRGFRTVATLGRPRPFRITPEVGAAPSDSTWSAQPCILGFLAPRPSPPWSSPEPGSQHFHGFQDFPGQRGVRFWGHPFPDSRGVTCRRTHLDAPRSAHPWVWAPHCAPRPAVRNSVPAPAFLTTLALL